MATENSALSSHNLHEQEPETSSENTANYDWFTRPENQKYYFALVVFISAALTYDPKFAPNVIISGAIFMAAKEKITRILEKKN